MGELTQNILYFVLITSSGFPTNYSMCCRQISSPASESITCSFLIFSGILSIRRQRVRSPAVPVSGLDCLQALTGSIPHLLFIFWMEAFAFAHVVFSELTQLHGRPPVSTRPPACCLQRLLCQVYLSFPFSPTTCLAPMQTHTLPRSQSSPPAFTCFVSLPSLFIRPTYSVEFVQFLAYKPYN